MPGRRAFCLLAYYLGMRFAVRYGTYLGSARHGTSASFNLALALAVSPWPWPTTCGPPALLTSSPVGRAGHMAYS